VDARDRTKSGDPVTNVKRSNTLYATAMRYNPDLDRDRDKVACEKHWFRCASSSSSRRPLRSQHLPLQPQPPPLPRPSRCRAETAGRSQQRSIRQLRAKLADARVDLKTTTQERDAAEARRDALIKERNALASERDQLALDKKTLQDQKATLGAAVTSLTTEVNRLRNLIRDDVHTLANAWRNDTTRRPR
jgi:hypothetical protein